jgi:hypothetical protein
MRYFIITAVLIAFMVAPARAQDDSMPPSSHGPAFPSDSRRGPAFPKSVSPTDSNPTSWVSSPQLKESGGEAGQAKLACERRLHTERKAGITDAEIDEFCNCMARKFAKLVTDEDRRYFAQNNRPSPELQERLESLSPECMR